MKIIFCNGQPKSGSTFCFELMKRLVVHEDIQTMNEPLYQALAINDEAQRILYRELGEYTGFVNGSILSAARVFAKLPLPIDGRLILKVHDAEPAPAPLLPGDNRIITTFRDPLDVMVALRDQLDRERMRPAELMRPAFLANDTYAKALARTENFMSRLVKSFSPHNAYLEYPCFIRPSDEQVGPLAALFGVGKDNYLETAKRLNLDSRAGRVDTEFNRGEEGRGRQIIDDLVRNGSVPRRLVQQAVSWHRKLVHLVLHHRSGHVLTH